MNRMIGGYNGTARAEGRFYREIRPELGIESPHGYFSAFDRRTLAGINVLEDVATTRGVRFCDHSTQVTRAMAESMVDLLAALHTAIEHPAGEGLQPRLHLAAVVDDHLMGITHVIRAEEWLNSLPKHIWLNDKLGFTPPEYVHVGLLRNADKSKISKRKNPTNLMWYKAQGYLPEALVNFLATRLGTDLGAGVGGRAFAVGGSDCAGGGK